WPNDPTTFTVTVPQAVYLPGAPIDDDRAGAAFAAVLLCYCPLRSRCARRTDRRIAARRRVSAAGQLREKALRTFHDESKPDHQLSAAGRHPADARSSSRFPLLAPSAHDHSDPEPIR